MSQGTQKMTSWEYFLDKILGSVCAGGEWVYGEAWVKNDKNILVCHDAYFCADSKRRNVIREFRAAGYSLCLGPGEDMAGRVMETASPEWLVDVCMCPESVFWRWRQARIAGLRAALAVPCFVSDGNVQAVLVFFSDRQREFNRNMMKRAIQTVELACAPWDTRPGENVPAGYLEVCRYIRQCFAEGRERPPESEIHGLAVRLTAVIPLFQKFADLRVPMCRAATLVEYNPYVTIFSTNDPATACYVILRGSVVLFDDATYGDFNILTSTDSLGEAALLEKGSRRTVTAITCEKTEILVIDANIVHESAPLTERSGSTTRLQRGPPGVDVDHPSHAPPPGPTPSAHHSMGVTEDALTPGASTLFSDVVRHTHGHSHSLAHAHSHSHASVGVGADLGSAATSGAPVDSAAAQSVESTALSWSAADPTGGAAGSSAVGSAGTPLLPGDDGWMWCPDTPELSSSTLHHPSHSSSAEGHSPRGSMGSGASGSSASAAAAAAARRSKQRTFIEYDALKVHFDKTVYEAARDLGVSPSTLKKSCRQHGIQRWPFRKMQMLDRNIHRLRSMAASVLVGGDHTKITNKLDILSQTTKTTGSPQPLPLVGPGPGGLGTPTPGGGALQSLGGLPSGPPPLVMPHTSGVLRDWDPAVTLGVAVPVTPGSVRDT